MERGGGDAGRSSPQPASRLLQRKFRLGFGECPNRELQILAAMGRAHLRADARGALRHDGIEKADHVDSFFQHPPGEFLGQRCVAEHDGNDRVLAGFQHQPGFCEAGAEKLRVRFERVAQSGGTRDEIERRDRSRRNGGSKRIGEKIRSGALSQESDDFFAAADVAAARAAQRLAECAAENVDSSDNAAVFVRAAARLAYKPDRMTARSGAMNPSIENTPSVTMSLKRAFPASASRSFASKSNISRFL
jgi:hypothetical protein